MAPAPIGTLFFVEQTVYKAQKALVTAKFNGVTLDTKKFDATKDLRKPDFIAKNPTGKVPYLETDMGCIFTSNAIARYVARCRADTAIYGKCFDDEGQIDSWLEFCTQEIEVPLMIWVYPVLGLMEDVPDVTKSAQVDIKAALAELEKALGSSAFLIGDFVSVADIALVCALREGFVRVFEPSFRKPYPKVCAWFEKCCDMPQFKTVFGETKLCTKAEQPQPVKKDEKKAKAEAKAKAEPRAKAQPKAEPKAKVEPKAEPKAAPAPAMGAVAGPADEQIAAIGNNIRELKAKLKAEGLSGKKIDKHEEVVKLVAEMNALKEQAAAAPAAAPAEVAPARAQAAPAAAAGGDLETQIKAIGDQIRTLKDKLKAEGITGKKLNNHEEVAKLVAQLNELKAKQ